MEQPEWDGMEWREVDDGMEVQPEWVVMVWTEVEPAAFVEDVGCGTRLEWRAADSAKSSDALKRQSETGPVAVVDSETEGRNWYGNCQSLVVESPGSS